MSHLFGAWLLGKGYEKIWKRKISHYGWFFLLAGSIIPDLDFLLEWTILSDAHRTFSHSLLFALVVGILCYLVFKRKEYGVGITVGVLSHLFLDMFFAIGIPLLWPSTMYFSYFKINYLIGEQFGLFSRTAEEYAHIMRTVVIDMAIGAGWIFYLWWRKRLRF